MFQKGDVKNAIFSFLMNSKSVSTSTMIFSNIKGNLEKNTHCLIWKCYFWKKIAFTVTWKTQALKRTRQIFFHWTKIMITHHGALLCFWFSADGFSIIENFTLRWNFLFRGSLSRESREGGHTARAIPTPHFPPTNFVHWQ